VPNNPKTAAVVSKNVFIDAPNIQVEPSLKLKRFATTIAIAAAAICLRSSNFRCCAVFATYLGSGNRIGLRRR
jgi:hypothetical protein